MSSTLAQPGAEAIRHLLARALESSPIPGEVVDLRRLKGGYSREMWSFDAVTAGGEARPLILCVDSTAGVVGGDQALGRTTEAALLHQLHDAGLPVPDAFSSGGADSPFRRPFLIMQRGTGTAAIGPLHRDPWYVEHRVELGRQLADILAAIHAAYVPEEVLGPCPAPAEVAPRQLAQWAGELASTPAARTEVLDRAIEWMNASPPPPPAQVTVVHGDYRTGNILHGHDDGDPGGDGLRTMLDWEMTHYGDPVEDVAWAQLVCWRVGTDRVGGLVDLALWPDLYGAAAGVDVDAAALRWWEILGSVKMSCLLWRASAVVTAPGERALLDQLFRDLRDQLERIVPGRRTHPLPSTLTQRSPR